jgi:hypothetical protein
MEYKFIMMNSALRRGAGIATERRTSAVAFRHGPRTEPPGQITCLDQGQRPIIQHHLDAKRMLEHDARLYEGLPRHGGGGCGIRRVAPR